MNILVFDTCFNKSYIVLSKNGTITSNKIIESTDSNYHSAFLVSALRNILKENNLIVNDLDAIGVDIGPGSFTGIRVGITIARVLAQQANIKLVGVNSLEILSNLIPSNKKIFSILDARKNKVYFYDSEEKNSIPILLEKELLFEKLNVDSLIITDKSIREYLQEKNIESVNFEEIDKNLGIKLACLVAKEIENNKNNNFHWAKLKPLYIQPPSITKPKKK